MMSGHVSDTIGPYLLGELSEAEARAFDVHVAACWICRKEVSDARAVLDVLPQALDPIAPPERLFANILAAIDEPVTAHRRPSRVVWPLAAALALALLGDAMLGVTLTRGRGPTTVAVAPSPVIPTALPRTTSVPRLVPTATVPRVVARIAPAAVATPEGHPRAARTHALATIADPRVPKLRDELATRDRELERLRAFATEDIGRLADLSQRLKSASGNGTRDAAIVAALATGRAYSVSGFIGAEAWNGTVVQASRTSNAVLITRPPSAPAGIAYHAWVVRGKTTFDIGALPPNEATTIQMPMPLIVGDVVAFSRESEAAHAGPTLPYLMEVPISQ